MNLTRCFIYQKNNYLISILLVSIYFIITNIYAQNNINQANKYIHENQYQKAIELLTIQKNTDQLTDQDLILLGKAFLLQAQLYRDLYKLQNKIGVDYFQYRDTSKISIKTDYDPFFFGRYLFETEQYEKAAQLFNKVSSNVPINLQTRAKIWKEAALIKARGEKPDNEKKYQDPVLSAEYIFAMWEAGSNVPAIPDITNTNSPLENRMSLWYAVQNRKLEKILFLINKLTKKFKPDVKQTIHANYTINFYDPSTLKILYLANYTAASCIFEKIKNNKYNNNKNYYSGLSSYEAGDYIKAQKKLEHVIPPTPHVHIYLGAVYYIQNNRQKANALWNKIKDSANTDVLYQYTHVLHNVPEKMKEVNDICEILKDKTKNMNDALYAARCYLEAGNGKEKALLKLVQDHYPILKHNKIKYIQPSYLTVYAHIKYLNGRKYFADVLGHLSAVSKAGYYIQPILMMARAYMSPENPTGEKRISY